jgi:Transglycosylase SLT domain
VAKSSDAELEELGLLLGGSGILLFAYLWHQTDWGLYGGESDPTDLENMNSFGIRGYAILCTMGRFGIEADVQHCRAVMLIIWNESHGNPANYIGDTDQALPSVGPMQVNGTTAAALGYVDPGISPTDYEGYADDPLLCIWWGVGVLRDKILNDPDVAGDLALGVMAYNGSGEAAATYLANAQAEDQTIYNDQIS